MSVAHWEFGHARRFGGEIGLIHGDRRWTNAELHDRARSFATALVRAGLAPGDRVALALENSPDLFVAYSGAVMAGAAVAVLGDHLSEELEAKLAHCEPFAIVLEPHLADAARRWKARLCVLAGETADAPDMPRFEALIADHAPIEAPVERASEDIVQLCYTSGSTGKPKAVAYTHGATDAFLQSVSESVQDPHAARIALVSCPPTAFASRFVGVRHVANMRYVLLPKFSALPALEAIEKHGVHDMSLLPTMAELLLAQWEQRRFECSSLRGVYLGGAHVPKALVERLREKFAHAGGGAGVVVGVSYGLTEAGGGFANSTDGGDGVVGHVSQGVQVRIVGSDGLDATPGEVGEIVVRAPFAAQGYWRDEEQTSAVFRDGFVHTGDLGCLREDGQLCVVGRCREIIIQGGTNIYPAELTRVIYRLEGVVECAVVGLENTLLGEEAVACVVRKEGAGVTEATIRAHCRASCDSRKQPVRIVFVDALPKTDSGKVDLAKLRAEARRRTRQHGVAPLPAIGLQEALAIVEHELRAILRDDGDSLPEDAQIDAHATFGELGLSSRGAVRLANALSERFARSMPATLAYVYPTIGECAAWLAAGPAQVEGSNARDAGIDSAREAPDTQIAIIGLGARLPGGVSTPRDFWHALWNGVDTVCELPVDRRIDGARPWRASFLRNAASFDAPFFRLTAQAAEMDPRHRHLLEVCWEALENAGCDPASVRGERTGVFLGLYGQRYASPNPLSTAPGMAAGYLCQFFDFRGPVVTVDTTCSSSLVALHSAIQSLRAGECDIAIAGGANILSDVGPPDLLGVLSKDGRSRAFDASADGFGQGEGCVLLVLKRAATARAEGDRIRAVLLGSAINHDGRSTSLTAPNPESQASVISRALGAARVKPDEIQYIEAHGTGTLLGDPIEIDGIVRSLGKARRRPLAIGSVKTNIGHLEAAAGVAGVAKVVLAIEQRKLPASAHFQSPNPYIPWSSLPVKVQGASGPWPAPAERLIAGVSSFGMSGTNAHVIVGEPAPESSDRWAAADAAAKRDGRWLLPLSAKSEDALRAAASRWAHALEREEAGAGCRDIAYTASCRRSHLPFRLAVSGSTPGEWARGLRGFLSPGSQARRIAPAKPRKLALVFSGLGSQWAGMHTELCRTEPAFRDTFARCAALVEHHLKRRSAEASERWLGDAVFAEPALFAMQASLYELLKAWGVKAATAVGFGPGEVAAAYALGALTLEQGVELACERSRARLEGLAATLPAPVSLREAADELLEEGCTAFLEVSPHPVQLCALREIVERTHDAIAVGSLRKGEGASNAMLDAVGELFCSGVPVDWKRRYAIPGRHADLPTYAWDHAPYWYRAESAPAQEVTVIECLTLEGECSTSQERAARVLDELARLAEVPREALQDDRSLDELGIDSLGLGRLRSSLPARTGAPVSASDVRPDTTVAELLRAVTGGGAGAPPLEAEATSPLVWLRNDGESPTHVWIHPVGGGVDCYRPLARELPFLSLAIESPALRSDACPAESLDTIVSDYLRLLYRADVSGPLVLAGWSFGGVVALAMASRLEAEGRPVSRVILIDSYAGDALPADALSKGLPSLDGAEGFTPEQAARMRAVYDANCLALRNHIPGTYTGEVLSVRAVPSMGDPDRLWRASAPRLKVVPLQADHFSIVSAPLRAQLVRALLHA